MLLVGKTSYVTHGEKGYTRLQVAMHGVVNVKTVVLTAGRSCLGVIILVIIHSK